MGNYTGPVAKAPDTKCSSGPRLNLRRTADIRNPHEYVRAMHGECADWVHDEVDAPRHKGFWRSHVFGVSSDTKLDLEIGTGNGFFFAERAKSYPERCLLGLEVKFKPLIQSVRRARSDDSRNFRMLRYDGRLVHHLFQQSELNNVFIHHPDPWHKRRQQGRRLMQAEFLKRLFKLQKPGSRLEFKTDSLDYFHWAEKQFAKSLYVPEFRSTDFHSSERMDPSCQTHFEKLFARQGVPINYLYLRRP